MKGGEKAVKAGAILWMGCLQFFLAEQAVRSAWTHPYSFVRNYVSDLGAAGCGALVCSPWHALMNASFVLQGFLISSGAVLTWRRWNGLGRIAMLLLMICGAGVVVVGFVTEDGNGRLHRFGAALHFLGGGLGITAVGLSLRQAFGWASIAAGAAVLGATAALGLGAESWIDVGALERVAAYGIAGWMFAVGAWLYGRIHLPD